MGFFSGTPGKWSQQSNLNQGQQALQNNLLSANQGQGAGGSFGDAGDYYRSLLSNDNETYNQMQAPELRQFREQIIPDISEQFAGMGAGGLSSSGFRNASINAGTDLSERLGAMRAQLRQQGAQGLMGLGQQGLQQTNENIYTQGQPGFLDAIGKGIGGAATGFAMGGPAGALAGGLGGLFNRSGEQTATTGQKAGIGWKPPQPQQPGQPGSQYGIPPVNQYGLRM